MTVLVGNDVPDAIRGHLKRWFVEPRPNVFVGTLNRRTHARVVAFIIRNAPKDFGILSISSSSNCQGYEIERIGPVGKTGKRPIELSGIDLVADEWIEEDLRPF